jgi:hypothetical protein
MQLNHLGQLAVLIVNKMLLFWRLYVSSSSLGVWQDNKHKLPNVCADLSQTVLYQSRWLCFIQFVFLLKETGICSLCKLPSSELTTQFWIEKRAAVITVKSRRFIFWVFLIWKTMALLAVFQMQVQNCYTGSLSKLCSQALQSRWSVLLLATPHLSLYGP